MGEARVGEVLVCEAREWAPSVSDLDDLVDRVRAAGGDTAVVGALRAALVGGGDAGAAGTAPAGTAPAGSLAPADLRGLKRRVVVHALFYGGSALDALLLRLDDRTARYVRLHAARLAVNLDRTADWAVQPIAQSLAFCGVPRSSAPAAGRALSGLTDRPALI